MTREEAINEIKKAMPTMWKETKEAIGVLIPELIESEDERIRKWLIEMVEEIRKANPTNAEHNGNCSKAISYLENQKEQKSEWSKEDEEFFKTALWHISYSISNRRTTDYNCDTTNWLKNVKERLKYIRPSWKPSKEQMEELRWVAYENGNSIFSPHSIKNKELASLYEQLKKNYIDERNTSFK